MALVAEVACALTIRESAAAGLLVEARVLASGLPLTLSALEAGSISWQHARIMVDETSGLGPEGARALEAHFLDPDAPGPVRSCLAGELVPGRFRARARAWRERHHPVSIEKRYAKCVADRRVLFSPDRDGMAWLSAYLPAETASGIWERTTAAARAVQGPDEGRTLTQLRADNAAAWLLGGAGPVVTDGFAGAGGGGSADATASSPGVSTHSTTGVSTASTTGVSTHSTTHSTTGVSTASTTGVSTHSTTHSTTGVSTHRSTASTTGVSTHSSDGTGAALVAGRENQAPRGVPTPRAQVLVTVPVMALLGKTEEPAVLDGYGPIPPSMARRLVADGAESFHRVLVDPRDGAPLEIGRTSYRVTRAQRQWLRLRDGKCPFPGCSNQSLDNEADHVLAWAEGGATGISNLGQPCPKHHRLRHTTTWTPTQPGKNEPPGWTSPTGRHYNSEHPDWEPPHWPKEPCEPVEPVAPTEPVEPVAPTEPVEPVEPTEPVEPVEP